MENRTRNTVLLAIIACWLWSTAFVFVKIGLQFQPPLQFAAIRFFISGLLLLIFFKKARSFFQIVKTNIRFVILIAFLQIFWQYSFFYTGLNLVPGALGAMIVGSSPIFTAIVAHFAMSNDKLSPIKTISILVGVVGIIIITLGRTKIVLKNELEWVGILLLLINNVVSGYSNVLISKDKSGISPVALSSASLIIGSLMLFTVSVPLEGIHFESLPLTYFYALAWLGFISAAAFAIWFTLLKRPEVKVSNLNVWKFLIPVSGAILSWIILPDESPDWISISGMVIIAFSLTLLGFSARKSSEGKTLS